MKKATTTQITFTQANDNKKAVVADKYVAHAIYTQNKAIVEELGGSIIKGVDGFRAEFTSVKNAKAFIEKAITGVSKSEYNKARKTEPKKVATVSTPTQKGKGKAKVEDKTVTVTINGVEYTVPKSALVEAKAPTKAKAKTEPKAGTNVKAKAEKKVEKKPTTSRKGKGVAKVELSEKAQKQLEFMKMSVLNRAASAYSIANGGEPITFEKLGKSKTVLANYLPKAKADLLKSSKWAKAVELGITADMLD